MAGLLVLSTIGLICVTALHTVQAGLIHWLLYS